MKSIFKISFAILAVAVVALAHHSSAGFLETPKTISGTIKEFQFKNPHSWIQVNVKDATGKLTEWSIEWGSPNQLGREGIRPSTFPAGAEVTIRMRPEGSGAPLGIFIGAKMADGKTVGKWEGD